MLRGASRCFSTERGARVFGVSNCRGPVRISPPPYEFRGAGAPRQYVRATGLRRLQDSVGEIKALIGGLGTDADL